MTEDNELNALHKLDGLVRERKDALTVRWLFATIVISIYSAILGFSSNPLPVSVPIAVTVAAWLAAIGLAAFSLSVPRKALADEHLIDQLREEVLVDIWARRMQLTEDQTRELAALPLREQRLFGLTLLFDRPYTMSLAITGVVAITGLAYGLVVESLYQASPFLLGALVLNCVHYPRMAGLIDRGRRLLDREEEEALNEMRGHRRRKPSSQRPPAASPAPAAPAAAGVVSTASAAAGAGASGDTKQRLYEMLREREAKARARRQNSSDQS